MREYRQSTGTTPRERAAPATGEELVIAIDGEGFTGKDGIHRYVYLAASTKDELVSELAEPDGLTTAAVLEWLLLFPKNSRIVMFGGTYDWTLWFRDLSNGAIYDLWRPECREVPPKKKGGHVHHRPIRPRVHGGRVSVNMLSTRLTVRRKKGKKSLTVWDLFKFSTMSFVATLREFGVGTKRERAAIQRMKDQRGKFQRIGPKERKYCQHETRLLARLAEQIDLDLEKLGLKITNWFGAGAIAQAMLEKCDAKSERARAPRAMDRAIDCAFFAGRFEISACGPILDAHADDVASAFAYAETQLPCLKHGTWEYVKGSHEKVLRAVRGARVACVRYDLPSHESIQTHEDPELAKMLRAREAWVRAIANAEKLEQLDDQPLPRAGKIPRVPSPETLRVSRHAWGPFPFRLKDGSILFPMTSGGGWVWSPELLTAFEHPELWPNIRLRGAWVLRSRCQCDPPFLKDIAKYYIQRLEWGKDGRGLLVKKGLTARYGKRSQRIGAAPFQDLVAAGLITSFVRAMTLEGIGRAPDPWDVIGISTDAIFSRRRLELPKPKGTGTAKAAKRASRRDRKRRSALGAWEHTHFPKGLFFIRPGQRFAIGKSDLKTTAARGLGIRVLHGARKEVLEAWKRAPRAPIDIDRPPIFHGAKLTVSFSEEGGYTRSPRFGQWAKPDPWHVSYEPLPKRPCFDGETNRLLTWALGAEHGTSSPYDPKVTENDPTIQELRDANDEADAQPDGGIDTMGEDI